MERRKITTLGKYSLVVTLPKDWTTMNSLQGGDEVSMKIQGDGSLVIHPDYDLNEKQNSVVLPLAFEEDIKMIQRKIIGCYLNGYDKIFLVSEKNFTREQQEAIRFIVKSLYMRIYESTASKVTLQAFMDESLASVISGLERMHIITNSMAQDVVTALTEWDIGLARSVISLEEDVDQFMFFLTRLLRTAVNNPSLAGKLQVSMSDCFDYHLLVNRIEYVADYLTNISETFVKLHPLKEKIPDEFLKSLIDFASKYCQYYEMSVNSFFDGSIVPTGDIIDSVGEANGMEEAVQDLPNKDEEDKQVILLCQSIVDDIQRIGYSTADIAELTIDRHYTPT